MRFACQNVLACEVRTGCKVFHEVLSVPVGSSEHVDSDGDAMSDVSDLPADVHCSDAASDGESLGSDEVRSDSEDEGYESDFVECDDAPAYVWDCDSDDDLPPVHPCKRRRRRIYNVVCSERVRCPAVCREPTRGGIISLD